MTKNAFSIDITSGENGMASIAGAQSGDGPPLLMLHGGPGTSDYMSLLAGEAEGWQAIHYQQRGIAPSAPGGPFTIGAHVADAVAVLDGLGLSRAVVLGHSFGAHLALQLAVAAPERVAGLVLIDGLGVADPDGGAAVFGQNLVARLPEAAMARLVQLAGRIGEREPTDAEATDQLGLLWPAYFADPARAPGMPAGMTVSVAVNAETQASVTDSVGAGFAARLAGLTAIPAVLLLGELSPMPHSVGRQVAGLIPGAETVIVPGAGHLPWHEQPGCVAAALKAVAGRASLTP